MKGFMARKNPAAVATANGAQDSFASSAQHSTAAVHVQMMRLFPASRRAHATYDPGGFSHTRRADRKLAVLHRTVRQPGTLDLWKPPCSGKYPLVLGVAGCQVLS